MLHTTIRPGTRFKVSEVTTGDQNDTTHYYSSRYKFKVSEVTTGGIPHTTIRPGTSLRLVKSQQGIKTMHTLLFVQVQV